MNIQQAKEEIKYAVRAYLEKDEGGDYRLEERFCRPLLLIGAPGIGKTAIMRQIADEMGINLVSYTITHHTRQSAIGLPVVEKKLFGGEEYSVTEYTMSEIVAEVHEQIERSGIGEGILFLDEINCVSETLLPTMLQFLQYKTFGTHKVPRGFVIVCAGNPPQYNRSAREFDIVTLDRVRRLDIDVDLDVFFSYAGRVRMHGAVQAFLDIKKDCFYRITADVEETRFVTARSWEDLSQMLLSYERNGFPITAQMVGEYLEDAEIAEAFFVYYKLYQKYHSDFAITDILAGAYTEGGERVANAPFDEKLSLLHLLLDALDGRFYEYDLQKRAQEERAALLREKRETMEPSAFEAAKAKFEEAEDERQNAIDETDAMLTRVFSFLDRTFGEGQEMVLFLTALGRGHYVKLFLADCGNEAYEKYSHLLLLRDERKRLVGEVQAVGEI